MSQVAFSHQFAHRWTNAPQEVKGALIQELGDIVHLLDDQTDLDSFEFTNPNLGEYIDNIYSELEAEREAQLEVERLQQEHQAAHHSYREQHGYDNEHSMTTDTQPEVNDSEPLETVEEELESNTPTNTAQDSSDKDQPQATEEPSPSNEQDDINTVQLANTSDQSAPNAFNFDDLEGKLDADFVKELENRIDDYLSEQLANMSEDLKAWLRDQISHQINSK